MQLEAFDECSVCEAVIARVTLTAVIHTGDPLQFPMHSLLYMLFSTEM